MVYLLPPRLAKKPAYSEKVIFNGLEALTSQPNWMVIHSLKQTKVFANIQAETDFVIFVPGKGIVVVEAKHATDVKVEGEDWLLEGVPEQAKSKNPFTQIDNAIRNIRGALKNAGYEVNSIPFARLVWFTAIGVEGFTFARTGMSFGQDEIAYRNDLGDIAGTIGRALDSHIKNYESNSTVNYAPEKFSFEHAQQFAEVLRPHLSGRATAADRAADRAAQRVAASDEQLIYLDLLDRNNLLYFEGPAGSGKTVILRQAALDFQKQGRRVLFVCYNELLSQALKADIGLVAGITVMNFNEVMLTITGQTNPKNADNQWYQQTLPEMAFDWLSKNEYHPDLQFEAICFDEFQDVGAAPRIFDILQYLVVQKTRPFKIVLAGDDQQQIFSSQHFSSFDYAKDQAPDLMHVGLYTNCRQAPGLPDKIQKLLGGEQRFKRSRITSGEPGSLDVLEVTQENQAFVLADLVQKLESKYPISDIKILSIFGEHSSCVARLDEVDKPETKNLKHLKTLTEHKKGQKPALEWHSIGKFKGLEGDVVIITDISQASRGWLARNGKTLKDQLYVGLSRARTRAFVLVQDGLFADDATEDFELWTALA